MARLSKEEWLEQSFEVLAEVGVTGLTIDALTKHLGVTKGSFYHHFTNFQTFKTALLDFFEDAGTLNVIRITSEADTPEGKLRALVEATTGYPAGVEVQMRAWALQDDEVRAYQERIDQRRLDYVKDIFMEMTNDETISLMMAQMLYTLYIGGTQLFPPISGKELAKLYTLHGDMFKAWFKSKGI